MDSPHPPPGGSQHVDHGAAITQSQVHELTVNNHFSWIIARDDGPEPSANTARAPDWQELARLLSTISVELIRWRTTSPRAGLAFTGFLCPTCRRPPSAS